MATGIRQGLRSALRKAYRLLLGPEDASVLSRVARRHPEREVMFLRAAEFVNFEAVEGDILEFGVFGGLSLLLLAHAHRCDPKGMVRRVVGFDSFSGLPGGEETHPRWTEGDCARMHGWHPFLRAGDPVGRETTVELFRRSRLPLPELEEGPFEKTIPAAIPSKYSAAAIVHIDCDLFESTELVLNGIRPVLQEGTVLLFDEWFSYKGSPKRGEARAFEEFLNRYPEWGARHYQTYGTFSNSYILYRK